MEIKGYQPRQCVLRDYMDACMNMAMPGHEWCKWHTQSWMGALPVVSRPLIVCLCGSTRFWETFRDVGLELTMSGVIVLSIGTHAPDSMTFAHPNTDEGKRTKEMLDRLHKSKIDLADEILVLNVDGYIGDSTRSEIEHANNTGTIVRYLEQPEKA